jgi:hypothetical protein
MLLLNFFRPMKRSVENRLKEGNQTKKPKITTMRYRYLPNELLCKIFSYINIENLMKNVQFLNKRHSRLVLSPLLWKSKGLQEKIPKDLLLFLIQKVGQHWKKLKLENEVTTSEILVNIANNCSDLTYVHLRMHNHAFTLSNIQFFLSKLNKVKSLNLFQLLFTDKTLSTNSVIQMKNLKNLNIKVEESINLLKLIYPPNLESLRLICTDFTNETSRIIASKFSKNLRELTVSTLNPSCTDEGMKELFDSVSKIESLIFGVEFIAKTPNFSFHTLKFISKIQNLKQLTLDNPYPWFISFLINHLQGNCRL